MDVQQLRNFKEVAQLEHVTRAAEKLYMSQPNLSTSLKRLEKELGLPLFYRQRGRISLTPYCRLLLAGVTSALEALDHGISEARRAYGESLGMVKVASHLVDMTADILREFSRHNPGIGIRQFNYTNSRCVQALKDGTADIALLFAPPEDGEIVFTAVDQSPRLVMLSENHPLAGRPCIPLEQLGELPCICNVGRGDEHFYRWLSSRGITPQIVAECDNDLVETNLLTSGFGVSVSPRDNFIKLKHAYPQLPIAAVRFEDEATSVVIGYAYRRGNRLSPPVEQLCRRMEAFFADQEALVRDFSAQYWGISASGGQKSIK